MSEDYSLGTKLLGIFILSLISNFLAVLIIWSITLVINVSLDYLWLAFLISTLLMFILLSFLEFKFNVRKRRKINE